jgi:hypothetical protein
MTSARRVLLVAVSAAVAGGGCLATPMASRGYPLYPESGGRLAADQVARLSTLLPGGAAPSGGATSFIKAIDGRTVAGLDTAFELLPGCHVVETERRLVLSSANMSWTVDLGPRAFVFHMKPGHAYTVVVEMAESGGGTARFSVHGTEQSPGGVQMGAVSPTDPVLAAAACRVSDGAGGG